MQRRDKWILSQHLPFVPQDLSACRLRAKGCAAHTYARMQPRPGGKPPYAPADKEIRITNSSTSESWQIRRSIEREKRARGVFLRKVVERHFPLAGLQSCWRAVN